MRIQRLFQRYRQNKQRFCATSFEKGSFRKADLRGIDFFGYDLRDTDFSGANLSGANFEEACLEGAIFSDADIRGTKFTNANIRNSLFCRARAGLKPGWSKILIVGLFIALVLSGFPLSIAGWWTTYLLLPSIFQKAPLALFAVLVAMVTFFGIILSKRLTGIEAEFVAIVIFAFTIVATTAFPTILLGEAAASLSVAIPVLAATIGIAASVSAAAVVAAIKIISNSRVVKTSVVFALVLNAILVGASAHSVNVNRATVAAIAILEAHFNPIAVATTAIGGVASIILSAILSKRILRRDEGYSAVQMLTNVFITINGTSFRGADLTDADFTEASLGNVDFRNAKNPTQLTRTNFRAVKELQYTRLGSTYLKSHSIQELVVEKNGVGRIFRGLNLQGLNLQGAILSGADLTDANLNEASLRDAKLDEAKLVRTQLDAADLSGACIDRACIEDLGTTTRTILHNIQAKCVYMKSPRERRQPNDKLEFSSSRELIALIHKRSDVIRLYHTHGLKFSASQFAVNQISRINPGMVKEVTAFERIDDTKWLVSLRIAQNADESKIVENYFETYEQAVSLAPEYEEIYLSISNQNLGQFAALLPSRTPWKGTRVRLIFQGKFETGFTFIRLDVHTSDGRLPNCTSGSLSAHPQVLQDCQRLTQINRTLSRLSDYPRRSPEIIETDDYVGHISFQEVSEMTIQVQHALNTWLEQEEFRQIIELLQENLNLEDEFLICIESDQCPHLRQLPWHSWNLLNQYRHAEIAFSKSKSIRRTNPGASIRNKPRVLSILGDDRGIDVEEDAACLREYLGDSDLIFLTQPQLSEFYEHLRDAKGWDIICFSGHSSSEWDTLSINQEESVNLSSLTPELKQVIERGLQLFILNSCDSLKLASSLESLCVPQVIAMRESVPDFIAQQFLRSFLMSFASGSSIGLSVRQARESLAEHEEDYPLATWMPILCQNYAEYSVAWADLPRLE